MLNSLHIAASSNDSREISRLLSISQDSINARDPCQFTPLQISVWNNDHASVDILLSHGGDPNLEVPNPYGDLISGTNALTLAADYGHREILLVLLAQDVPLTSKALYAAAGSNRVECAEEILKWTVNLPGTFADGITLNAGLDEGLRIAAYGWRNKIVQVILQHHIPTEEALNKAYLEAMLDENLYDDFHIANAVSRTTSDGFQKRTETVRLLLAAGANINIKGQIHDPIPEMTPLHQAARMGSRAKDIFDMILESHADVHAEDSDGRTPLFYAVLSDDVYFVQQLVSKGALVGAFDRQGTMPIHVLADNQTDAYSEILTFLLDHGANLESKDSAGRTTLLRAVADFDRLGSYSFRPDIILELLRRGADIEATNIDGRSFEDLLHERGWTITKNDKIATMSGSGKLAINVYNQG